MTTAASVASSPVPSLMTSFVSRPSISAGIRARNLIPRTTPATIDANESRKVQPDVKITPAAIGLSETPYQYINAIPKFIPASPAGYAGSTNDGRLRRRLATNEVARLVGDHLRRGVEVGRNHPRHDG